MQFGYLQISTRLGVEIRLGFVGELMVSGSGPDMRASFGCVVDVGTSLRPNAWCVVLLFNSLYPDGSGTGAHQMVTLGRSQENDFDTFEAAYAMAKALSGVLNGSRQSDQQLRDLLNPFCIGVDIWDDKDLAAKQDESEEPAAAPSTKIYLH